MRLPSVATLVAVIVLSLTGCGGEDKPKTGPAPSATQTRSTPLPSATPTPTPAAQPKGKYGVTVQITNWDKYADRPAVLAAKQIFEAVQASGNRGKYVPGLLVRLTGPARAAFTSGLQQAWADHLKVKQKGYWRVRSVTKNGATSTVVICAWRPSVDLYQSNGKPYGTIAREWKKTTAVLREGGGWKLHSFDTDGACPGAPPV
jgi:hypothetical protein